MHYWRYLEALFDEDANAKSVIDVVSNILGKNALIDIAFTNYKPAAEILSKAYHHFPLEELNPVLQVSNAEIRELLKSGPIKDIDFERHNQLINHPYVSKKLRWQLNSTQDEKIKIATAFYRDVLKEAYEQRILMEHAGTANEKAVQKISSSLVIMMRLLRHLIIEELKEEGHHTFTDAFKALEKR